MPKIICTIPGAPEEIGGLKGLIKFTATDAGMVADVSDEEASRFATIPGYALAKDGGDGGGKQAEAAERDALLARAAAVNLAVTAAWKLPRLKSEVEHAEKLAAEGGGGK